MDHKQLQHGYHQSKGCSLRSDDRPAVKQSACPFKHNNNLIQQPAASVYGCVYQISIMQSKGLTLARHKAIFIFNWPATSNLASSRMIRPGRHTMSCKRMLAALLVGFRFHQGSPAGACSHIYCCHFYYCICRGAQACRLNIKAEQTEVFLICTSIVRTTGTVYKPVERSRSVVFTKNWNHM